MRKIIFVEDEYRTREWICGTLRQVFAPAEVVEITTELDFQKQFQTIIADPPDIIILDMIIAWTSPAPDLQPPPKRVKRDGPNTAGLRCRELVLDDDRTKDVPVLFYTVLSAADLAGHLGDESKSLTYLQKESNLDVLIARIRELVDPPLATEQTN